MHQPQQRASRLRVVALASTVALAAALPLAAAVAGQEARPVADAVHEPGRHVDAGAPAAAPSQPADRAERARREPHGGPGGGGKSRAQSDVPRGTGAAGGARPASSCGPEVTSPEGVEAQTCVLTERRDTWARTYYRNATNGALTAVLTLMRPDGYTTEVHCPMPAADGPGTCETPRRTAERPGEAAGGRPGEAAGGGPYSAVAEVASADGARMLLRAGSNSSGQPGS